jgi:hypothetical protein
MNETGGEARMWIWRVGPSKESVGLRLAKDTSRESIRNVDWETTSIEDPKASSNATNNDADYLRVERRTH